MSGPDISFAVNMLSNHNPGKAHWEAVKQALRYLKGSKDVKLEKIKINSRENWGKTGSLRVRGFKKSQFLTQKNIFNISTSLLISYR